MTVERNIDGWLDDIVGALCEPIMIMPCDCGKDLPDWLNRFNIVIFDFNIFTGYSPIVV